MPPRSARRALGKSQDEIAALDQASTKAYPAADQVAQFLESISDPKNAVEEDSCARYDLRQQPGQADQRVQQLDQKLGTTLHGDQTAPCKWANGAPPGSNPSGGDPGYTGMEGLLNYAYVQTNSLNLFDQLGHALGITLVSAPGTNAPCGYQTGPTVPAEGWRSDDRPEAVRRVRRDPRRQPARHQLRHQPLGPFWQPRPLRPERLP